MRGIYGKYAKRIFDIVFSITVLVILCPFLALISIAVIFDSRGGVFYKQNRVGLHGKTFNIFKFRTMHVGADKAGLLTIGGRDPRVTRVGFFLRKYKLDELPQFLNVLFGSMSLIGPRPEVPKYVAMYNETQKKVLEIKPGITDYASIEFSNESAMLAFFDNPEEAYIQRIMPAKLILNLKYINQLSFLTDIRIIFLTIKKVLT